MNSYTTTATVPHATRLQIPACSVLKHQTFARNMEAQVWTPQKSTFLYLDRMMGISGEPMFVMRSVEHKKTCSRRCIPLQKECPESEPSPRSFNRDDNLDSDVPCYFSKPLSYFVRAADGNSLSLPQHPNLSGELAILGTVSACEDFFTIVSVDSSLNSQVFSSFFGRQTCSTTFSDDTAHNNTASVVRHRVTNPLTHTILSCYGRVVCVACGLSHVLLSTDTGKIFSYGKNHHGQLGTGRLTDEVTPVIVPVQDCTSKRIRVFAGYDFSFALEDNDQEDSGGTDQKNESGSILLAWGSNKYGQLGINSKEDALVPTRVCTPGNISSWVSVAGGFAHAAAVSSDGRVYCFGLNLHGQLGLSSTESMSVPQLVPIPDPVKQVSCGMWHTIFLTKRGEVLTAGCAPKFSPPPSLMQWSSNVSTVTRRSPSQITIHSEKVFYKPREDTMDGTPQNTVPVQCPFLEAPGLCKVKGLPTMITSVSAGPMLSAVTGKEKSTGDCLYIWKADELSASWNRRTASADVYALGQLSPTNLRSDINGGTLSVHCHAGASRVFAWLSTNDPLQRATHCIP